MRRRFPPTDKVFSLHFFKKAVLLFFFLAVSPAQAAPWDTYQLIMWQSHTQPEYAGLKRLGFTGTAVTASGGVIGQAALQARVDSGMPWYLENTLTDFLSPYHRYIAGKSVTALFDALKARRRSDPGDTSVFLREPGLSDPGWLASSAQRLTGMVRAQQQYRPLFYDLADESGIGDLAAAWDADISPASIAAFRLWLRGQYADLAALNRQWGSSFGAWDDVVPELTDAAMARHDDNFSAWSDFKSFMDVAFAAAVAHGTQAVHAADPTALAALEGGQIPGWGGYDYARLAPSVDIMEIYDAGNAMDLARAWNPRLLLLRTSFGAGPREAHAAWQNLLHGGRGSIVWDEGDVVQPDGSPTPRGQGLADVVRDIREVSPLLFAARPARDPVAVVVSQASFRVRWMLDHRVLGPAWSGRDAEREYEPNAWRTARGQVVSLLSQLGVEPDFLSDDMLGTDLRGRGVKLLILPQVIALSQPAIEAIAAFKGQGGTVVADTEPGLFDGHGRRRPAALDGLAIIQPALWADGAAATPQTLDNLAASLRQAGIVPRAALKGPDNATATGLDIQWFHHGPDTLLSVQMQSPWSAPPDLTLTFPAPARVEDLRHPAQAPSTASLTLHLDPITPALLRLSNTSR